MAIERNYALTNVHLTIGGVLVTGFAATDAFTWEWTAARATVKVGADGDRVYSRNNDRAIRARISLLGVSRAYALLYGLMDTQWGLSTGITPPELLPLQFALVDNHTGDAITANKCVFIAEPSPDKGQEPGDAIFIIELPNPVVVAGAKNLA